jgi:hypothetical protein
MAARLWLPLVLAALAAASPAGAQVTGKQALKQFTGAAKGVLSGLKAGLASERALLEVDLDALDAQLALGSLTSVQAAASLHLSLSDAQVALRPLASNAFLGLYSAAGDALTALAGGVPLAGLYPRGFYAGDGGAMDLQVPRVLNEWDRFYASVNKRLAKTRKVAEKQGIGLSVVFTRPFDDIGGRWADGQVVASTTTRPLSIDTVVAASVLANTPDGFIAVGGVGDNAVGSVLVELSRFGAIEASELVAPAGASDRWSTDTLAGFDNGPVVEGSYFFTARQGTGHLVDASIGVR